MKKVIENGILLLLPCMVFFAGCGSHMLTKAAYIRYIEDPDNGFRKERVVDYWRYKVQLKPAAYIFLQESKMAGTRDEYNKRLKQLKGWYFFNVYVQHDTIHQYSPIRLISTDMASYNVNLNYYLTQNKGNFTLYVDSLPLYPVIYHYENDYNLSPEDVFVVGFQLPEEQQVRQPGKLVLQYDDELLRNGMVRFVFKQNELEKEPMLTFN